MMPQGQLGQSQQPPWPIDITTSVQVGPNTNTGLLGNYSVQSPSVIAGFDDLFAEYQLIATAQPGFKLATLKRRKFTAQGRQERIAASLAALHAPQPTNLTLTQWKEI